ncbi:MAG TPA: hypothetical protein PKC24_10290 [Cyclobacteriaceae bacterium]|nr:hypothetical protein [Cyclobacteriaceae bacterium]
MDKKCLECGTKLQGRLDKKFCSDQCRSAYNNRLNSESTKLVRNIDHALKRNRRILKELNPNGKTKVHRDKLSKMGFDFNYFTSIYTTKEGALYKYCYEQGYLEVEKDYYLLVIKK